MRIEIILFIITAAILANIYTEGKIIKTALSYKKYYQMGAIVLGALFVYYIIKKNPLSAGQVLSASSDYVKYLPIDRGTSNILSPILDFTSKGLGGVGRDDVNFPVLAMPRQEQQATNRIIHSGKKATKRSVSETKKKYVAAQQGWKCGDCGAQLTAWFEVDHKIRLEYGGSNHIDNLVALCRECHGKKTTIENL
jgi:HNH endonuclease